jgi:hypothetical protein
MNIESYKAITNDMAKLHKTVVALDKVYDRPEYRILATLVQNMALNNENCANFSLDFEYDKIVKIRAAIAAMLLVRDSDVVKLVADQVEFSVEGNLGMEQWEKEVTMLDIELEIFEALYGIYNNPENKDQFGQTRVSNYNKGTMEKVLTKYAFEYLLEGKSAYGKFSNYGDRFSIFQAITLSSKFYEKVRSI